MSSVCVNSSAPKCLSPAASSAAKPACDKINAICRELRNEKWFRQEASIENLKREISKAPPGTFAIYSSPSSPSRTFLLFATSLYPYVSLEFGLSSDQKLGLQNSEGKFQVYQSFKEIREKLKLKHPLFVFAWEDYLNRELTVAQNPDISLSKVYQDVTNPKWFTYDSPKDLKETYLDPMMPIGAFAISIDPEKRGQFLISWKSDEGQLMATDLEILGNEILIDWKIFSSIQEFTRREGLEDLYNERKLEIEKNRLAKAAKAPALSFQDKRWFTQDSLKEIQRVFENPETPAEIFAICGGPKEFHLFYYDAKEIATAKLTIQEETFVYKQTLHKSLEDFLTKNNLICPYNEWKQVLQEPRFINQPSSDIIKPSPGRPIKPPFAASTNQKALSPSPSSAFRTVNKASVPSPSLQEKT